MCLGHRSIHALRTSAIATLTISSLAVIAGTEAVTATSPRFVSRRIPRRAPQRLIGYVNLMIPRALIAFPAKA
jgi:hypothetical protein